MVPLSVRTWTWTDPPSAELLALSKSTNDERSEGWAPVENDAKSGPRAEIESPPVAVVEVLSNNTVACALLAILTAIVRPISVGLKRATKRVSARERSKPDFDIAPQHPSVNHNIPYPLKHLAGGVTNRLQRAA